MYIRSLISGLLILATGSAASAASEVNVYSYRQSILIKPMFDAFTEQTGIKVNTVFAKKGLVERLKNEGRNSPADLIFTVDIGPLETVLQERLTQAVESEVLGANIPAEFRDPDGHWFGLTSRARLIVASKDRVDTNQISSYEDLAAPAMQGKVCTRSGKHAYMVALIASVISHTDEDTAKDWLSGVKQNLARRPQGNDRAQVKAIHSGECDVAVINSYYLGKMLSDEEQSAWANAVNIIFPNQNDRGTHMNIAGMALTAAAPNKENAIKLMEFLTSDQAQSMYAELNHEYPVNPAVEWSELVSSWGTFKPDNLPLVEIAKHRATASKMVDEIGYEF